MPGPVVHIETSPYPTDPQGSHGGGQDHLPPSKVGDFRVNPIPNTANKLLATWTAPGGDYNVGMVASYKFLMSDNIADLLNPEVSTVVFWRKVILMPKVILRYGRLKF